METVADSKYSDFNPGWGFGIYRECRDPEEAPESFRLLLEKKVCDGRKVLVKRQNQCMHARKGLDFV